MFESGTDILIHVVVAEAVGQILAEDELGVDNGVAVPAVGETDGMIVSELVGIVPAVLEAVCEDRRGRLSR